MDTPRIYIACLACYNAGHLTGLWVDADQSAEDMEQEFRNYQAEHCKPYCSPHEEYAIHDHELGGIKIGEYTSLKEVAEIGEAIEEHGEKFVAAYENFGDVRQAISACEDNYQGCFKSLEDWAEQFIDDVYDLPKMMGNLSNYFDYRAFARDAELGGDIWTHDGAEGVHVFTNY